MRRKHSSADLFAGADHLSLDQRTFHPSPEDIDRICRFFSIGKLRHFEQEKNTIVSHSNFFVYVVTTHGEYALKFYPADAAQTIAIEYAVNCFLTAQHFPTPLMHADKNNRASVASTGRLATCFAYIDGYQAWQHINKRNTVRQINTAMLSLKNILLISPKNIPFLSQEKFSATVSAIIQTSRAVTPYDQNKMIEKSLQNICRTYQDHGPLFTRQKMHNNSTLTNFLIDKKTIYTLDLSHVREDYILSDLTALVISCIFLNIPETTIKTIIKNYFIQHKIKKDHVLVLNTLIRLGLIKEYLKNVRREKSENLLTCPPNIAKTYLFHLIHRKKLIISALKGTTALSSEV